MISPNQVQPILNEKSKESVANCAIQKKKRRKKPDITIIENFVFQSFKNLDDLEEFVDRKNCEDLEKQKKHDLINNNEFKKVKPEKILKPKGNKKKKSVADNKVDNNNRQSDVCLNGEKNNNSKKPSKRKLDEISNKEVASKASKVSKNQTDDLAQALFDKEQAERRLTKLQEKLKQEQDKNRTLEEKLAASQRATERAQSKQNELTYLTKRLEQSSEMMHDDKIKLETDIRAKKDEVARAWKKAAVMKERAGIVDTFKIQNGNDTTKDNRNLEKKLKSQTDRQVDSSKHHDMIHQNHINPYVKIPPSYYSQSSSTHCPLNTNYNNPGYPYNSDKASYTSNPTRMHPSGPENLQFLSNGYMVTDPSRDMCSQSNKQYMHLQSPQLQRSIPERQYPNQQSLNGPLTPTLRHPSIQLPPNPYACRQLPTPSYMITDTITRQTNIIPQMPPMESSVSTTNRYLNHQSAIDPNLRYMSRYEHSVPQMYYPGVQERNYIESRLHPSQQFGSQAPTGSHLAQSLPMPPSLPSMPPTNPPRHHGPSYNPASNTIPISSASPMWFYETQRALSRAYTNLYQNTASMHGVHPNPYQGYPHIHL